MRHSTDLKRLKTLNIKIKVDLVALWHDYCEMEDHIAFNATLYKIQTEASGGWRIILDVPQSDSDQIMKLSEHRDQLLTVAAIPSKKDRV